MRLSKEAQSTLEYLTVMVLVMVGIVVMGPYVIRSVNAHLKMWEDVADDSYTDPMIKGGFDFPAPTCKCPKEPIGCGLGSCKPTEKLYQKNCTPLDCEPQETSCIVDDTCCTKLCGASGGCPTGQSTLIQCGNNLQPKNCVPDPICPAGCTGSIPDHATICTGSDQNVPSPTPWIPVANCTGAKCEAVCDGAYPFDPQLQRCQPPECNIPLTNVNGDCQGTDVNPALRCPPECPFIAGCDVNMSGGSNWGCVANNTATGEIYFQEGTSCFPSSSDTVIGTVKCSNVPPAGGLGPANCIIRGKSCPVWSTDWNNPATNFNCDQRFNQGFRNKNFDCHGCPKGAGGGGPPC